jgi:hypothetical protein
LRSRLDYRPVSNRVGKRNSYLDHVGTGLDDGIEEISTSFEIRISEHQESAKSSVAA